MKKCSQCSEVLGKSYSIEELMEIGVPMKINFKVDKSKKQIEFKATWTTDIYYEHGYNMNNDLCVRCISDIQGWKSFKKIN